VKKIVSIFGLFLLLRPRQFSGKNIILSTMYFRELKKHFMSVEFITFPTLTTSEKTCLSVVRDFNRVRAAARQIYLKNSICLARFSSSERNFAGLLVHRMRISWRIK